MGAVIHVFDLPPFIVTLAGMFLARGASFLLSTESVPITAPVYSTVSDFALRMPGGGRLTAIAIIMLVIVIGGACCCSSPRSAPMSTRSAAAGRRRA